MVRTQIESYLDTYSLEDILEFNDLTEEDVLTVLVEQELVLLPVKPTDVSWSTRRINKNVAP
jgi:hypothetical protein